MAEVTAEHVGLLLRAQADLEEKSNVAAQSRDDRDQTFLDVARDARVGLRELAAITGLHPNTVRAAIQRAAGDAEIDFEQPELDLAFGGTSLSPVITASQAHAPQRATSTIANQADSVRPKRANRTYGGLEI
ncbi:hypothetical protein GCM10025865_33670 (plasmid) [Paraoerskovia sediminicola]|uniref:Sigma-70, region 4 n=1 Tax=Paraoerskovia sediminicola TaxID=1138587 RepID=A0ABN6XGQ5_9CELL|nr:hypothetical protein [Paraoerskovia sediminicola]BDZ44025.1 hypothetical protein GCM10025865_33240 [Paraoerskovia sediminicola]BDZ44068.1 hypothetical protein GCM10025865_33670 [Paraoerskovia sediminicola]